MDAHHTIVVNHLDLAEALARRYSGSSHDIDDLRQVAYIGLIKASTRFEPSKGDDFVSFAVPTISGEIKRYLRDFGWVIRPPRHIQELRARLNYAVPALSQRLGHTPSLAELTTALGESSEDIEEALTAHNSLRPVSLDAVVTDDGALTLGDTLGVDDEGLERVEAAAEMAPALAALTERERRIVHLRYVDERTQQEIATELGVTQMQVSRLLTKILAQLRSSLSGARASVEAGAAEQAA